MRAEENKAVAHLGTQDAATDWSMKGKTVLFTGASRGMGRFAAIELARLGAEILVVGHNQARGAAAVEAIRGTGGSAQFLRADMGDADEVCALATAVIARSGPVNALIHSAGGLLPAGARTREGADRGFAQNFLGAFLLTRLLEDRLFDSAPARVIAVGSGAHRLVKTADVDALMVPGTADLRIGSNQRGRYQMRSYQTAKLAVTTWIYGLARRWAARGVTANLLDPGIVKGKSGSEHYEGPALMGALMSHVIPFFAAAGMQRGSRQYVRLAADPTLATVSGMYFVRGTASAACALAPSAGVLIACRAVQGAGAAIVMPLSLTLLTSALPPQKRGAVVGIWGGIAGLAVAAGPLIGGGITQDLTWHWIFWVNVPIGILATIGAELWLQESRGPRARLDIPALALVSSGVGLLIWGLVEGGQDGWGSIQNLTGLAAGTALLGGFIGWEARTPEPMIPLGLFRRVTFSSAVTTQFLTAAALYSAAFLISQFFQFALGDTPLGTGLRFLPWTATPLVVAPIAGALSDKTGPRALIVPGLVMQGAGLAWIVSLAARLPAMPATCCRSSSPGWASRWPCRASPPEASTRPRPRFSARQPAP
jgi:NAD(P)-dependent dehydrogenase (short-subunit alcohol dehydrogenase family)